MTNPYIQKRFQALIKEYQQKRVDKINNSIHKLNRMSVLLSATTLADNNKLISLHESRSKKA